MTGGPVTFGLSSLAMAVVGMLATRQLVPRAKRAGNFSRDSRTRNLNIAFAAVSIVSYPAQLGLAVALLADVGAARYNMPWCSSWWRCTASALGRAWVVTGIARRT